MVTVSVPDYDTVKDLLPDYFPDIARLEAATSGDDRIQRWVEGGSMASGRLEFCSCVPVRIKPPARVTPLHDPHCPVHAPAGQGKAFDKAKHVVGSAEQRYDIALQVARHFARR